MREIKFRAWDKDTNNWLEGVTYTLHTSGRLLVTPPHVELMQYTGLHDKQGKEIYEGDIVDSAWAGKLMRRVVKWGEMDNEYGVRGCGFILYDEAKEVKVIGNIYENSDLLEAQP